MIRTDRVGPPLSRRATLLAATALLVVLSLPADAAAGVNAEAFIRRLGDRTLALLDEPITPQEKLQGLKQLLDESTDLELIAKLVLGRYWRQATAPQQTEYLRLFKELVMQTMAERMSWYNGQTFEIIGGKPIDERDTMVSSRILRPSGKPPILVDWRVREANGAYLLIDILAEGVSLVVTQRSEAADVISQRGIDGLLGDMRTRLAKRDALPGTSAKG
jgi:phospholipid transport system substrate-binding protein